MADGSDRIESRLKEERRFHPSAAFVDRARLSSHHAYNALYRQSIDEPEEFWREQTIDLSWRTPWTAFSEWSLTGNAAKAKFFLGAKLNVTESCLDRHLATRGARRRRSSGRGSRATPARSRTSSFTAQVMQAAAALTELGVEAGDRVAIYMGMVPEAASRCSRARASARRTRSSSAGFSADALRDRINDCGAKVLLTQTAHGGAASRCR